jgi:hypothetical protein
MSEYNDYAFINGVQELADWHPNGIEPVLEIEKRYNRLGLKDIELCRGIHQTPTDEWVEEFQLLTDPQDKKEMVNSLREEELIDRSIHAPLMTVNWRMMVNGQGVDGVQEIVLN